MLDILKNIINLINNCDISCKKDKLIKIYNNFIKELEYAILNNKLCSFKFKEKLENIINQIVEISLENCDVLATNSSITGWDTTSNILKYYVNNVPYNVQLVGISLTTTEYLASSPPNLTYAQLSGENYTYTENVTSIANIISNIKIDWNSEISNKIPAIRIPLNADYWLYGSSQDKTIVNYPFTSSKYQQAIISIINKINNTVNSTYPIVYILDLHWNYSNGYKNQSANGGSPDVVDLLGQQPLGSAFNTTAFWDSICNVFGVDNNGNAINDNSGITLAIKKNIMFELYNEPYTNVVKDYDNNFLGYINGFTYNNNYYTGIGTTFLNIRETNNTANICILGAAEKYSYFDDSNYLDSSTKKFKNTYNCFTKLVNAVENGLVQKPGNDNTLYYKPRNIDGVIANLHPYAGFFTDIPNNNNEWKCKNPGYGSNTDANCAPLQLADFLLALTEGKTRFGDDIPNFKINFPTISTEYGQYNLPWGGYGTTNESKNAIDYTLSSKTFPGYYGYYYDKNGNQHIGPALVGMHEDFKFFNTSYLLWAARPNGEYFYDQYYKSFEYWNPNQPDCVIGNCNVTQNSTGPVRFISSSDFPQPNLQNCYEGSCPINGVNNNVTPTATGYVEGGTGADFNYLFNTYYRK